MKNPAIKFSIIIPVYNSEQTLAATLDSCLSQTYRNIEIICVNDCSTDASSAILEDYSGKDKRFQCINLKENVNSYMARKIGVQYITGDYVLFLDSDDTFIPAACAILYSRLKNNVTDIINFAFKNIQDNKICLPKRIKNAEEFMVRFLSIKPDIPSAVWTRAYRRQVIADSFSDMADFNAFMAEDVYTTSIIMHHAKSMGNLGKALVNYSDNGKSRGGDFNLQLYGSFLRSYNTVLCQLKYFFDSQNSPYINYFPKVVVHLLTDFLNLIPMDASTDENDAVLNLVLSSLDHEILGIYFSYVRKSSDAYISLFEANSMGERIKNRVRFFLRHKT